MGAANRDPEQFREPDRLDLGRADNRHVAFGWAAHFCFGAPLARIEGQQAFAALARRMGDMRLTARAAHVATQPGPAWAGRPPRRVLSGDGCRRRCRQAGAAARAVASTGRRRPAAAPLLAPEPGARVPLTRGQEQMWLDSQLAPDEPVYNEAVTVRRTGPCDVGALRRAFNLALSRHDAWRTNFAAEDGEAHQVIRPHADHPLPLVDLSDLPEAEREAQAMKMATVEDARVPFDLEHDTLVRPLLVRLSEDDHRLYLTLHHLIFDGVALRLLLSEMVEIYDALRRWARGRARRPARPVQPLRLLGAPEPHGRRCWSRRLAFWRDRLRGATPVELPDRPAAALRPDARRCHGAHLRRPTHRSTGSRRSPGDEGATFFLVLLTAYAVLLHRYSGQEDLVIAALVDGRRHRALEKAHGVHGQPAPRPHRSVR